MYKALITAALTLAAFFVYLHVRTTNASAMARPAMPQEMAQNSGKPHFKVAFVVSEGFNMIDFAGPWEVFQDANYPPAAGHKWEEGESVFQEFTVSSSTAPIHSTGGAVLVPAYTFANAPKPDIILMGAQRGKGDDLFNWLRKNHEEGATLVSICTGAAKLAGSGLLNGLPATTHHDYIDLFKTSFPAVKWQPNQRYVQASETIYSAGGLTSGMEMALHIVAKKAGIAVAEGTAKYMELKDEGWR